jgi:hypothetical protein
MRRLTLIIVLILTSVSEVLAQQTEWRAFYSDEFHFRAAFPGDPKETKENLEMSFGKTSARVWRLEQPKITYDLMVADFPDLSVEMSGKALALFYEKACFDLGGNYQACHGNYTNDERFGEAGLNPGFGTNEGAAYVLMFLTGKRFYLAKVSVWKSAKVENWSNIKKFFEEFEFAHPAENEKKLTWGLPKAESQNLKDN